jgi:hypothetical protein
VTRDLTATTSAEGRADVTPTLAREINDNLRERPNTPEGGGGGADVGCRPRRISARRLRRQRERRTPPCAAAPARPGNEVGA